MLYMAVKGFAARSAQCPSSLSENSILNTFKLKRIFNKGNFDLEKTVRCLSNVIPQILRHKHSAASEET